MKHVQLPLTKSTWFMNDPQVCMNNQAVSQEVIEGEAIGVKDESNKADNHSSSTEGKVIISNY